MESRGRMSHPPTCTWALRPGNRYCTFLSHFKVEAGADARYLKDALRASVICDTWAELLELRAR